MHYVAGYGRSGSTLLGRVLASEMEAVALGELHALGNQPDLASRVCSCGVVYSSCPYWAPVLQELSDGRVRRTSRRRSRLLNGWLGLLMPMVLLRGLSARVALAPAIDGAPLNVALSAASARSPGGIVDTSKTTRTTANRPRLLAAAGADVTVYLAQRPFQDIVESTVAAEARRGRSASEPSVRRRVRISRHAAHLSARWCARSLAVPVVEVDFDDIVARARRMSDPLAGNHMMTGNRARGDAVV